MRNCTQCGDPISEESFSFEQRLIDDHNFCRKCFDEIMLDVDLSYLDNPRFLAHAT